MVNNQLASVQIIKAPEISDHHPIGIEITVMHTMLNKASIIN